MMAIGGICAFQIGSPHQLGNQDMAALVLYAPQGVDLREGGSSSQRNDTVKGLSQGITRDCKAPLILNFLNMLYTVADPGGAAGTPLTGPNYFIFTYISAQKCPRRRSAPHQRLALPKREILDPQLVHINKSVH